MTAATSADIVGSLHEDADRIAASILNVQMWIDGGCSTWGTPSGELSRLVKTAEAVTGLLAVDPYSVIAELRSKLQLAETALETIGFDEDDDERERARHMSASLEDFRINPDNPSDSTIALAALAEIRDLID